MKLATILVALAAVALAAPAPDADTTTHVKRANVSYNRNTVNSVVASDQSISAQLRNAANRLQQNAKALAS
ncbi:hypothetical protein EC988_004020, partial [Linderina pennispora]